MVLFALAPIVSQAALVVHGGPQSAASAPAVGAAATKLSSATAPAQAPEPAHVALTIERADPTWVTSPAAGTYRALLAEWSKRAGYDYDWTVEKDVPVNGHDTFTGSYRDAVRRLLRTTELTSYQLKPCFYSNNYTRVVMKTTECRPNQNDE
jgi:hypothetical protein